MGTTLAHVIASGGHGCVLWCWDADHAQAITRDRRHPARPGMVLSAALRATSSLRDAVGGAALVVVSVASGDLRRTARAMAPFICPEQVLLSSTKGIELATLSCMSALLAEETSASAVGAITGPNITPEIMAGQPTAITVASPSPEAREMAIAALGSPRLRVDALADLRSLEMASVLKNVVAIAVGIAAGREMGYNAQGLVFARGLAEIESLLDQLGMDGAACRGDAVLGDLFLTATSAQSLNRRLGVELGRGVAIDEVLRGLPEMPEGIGAVRGCRMLARRMDMRLSVCEAAARILEGEAGPRALEGALMGEEPGAIE